MTDGRDRWRIAHAHEISNLNYGHFGAPTYDKRTEAWHFQRQSPSADAEDSDDEEEEEILPFNSAGFQLLHHRIHPSDEGHVEPQPLPYKTNTNASTGTLKWFPELTAANSILKGLQDEGVGEFTQDRLLAHQIILARTSFANTRSIYHVENSEIAVVVSVAGHDQASLLLRPLQLQQANIIGEAEIKLQAQLPLLSEGAVWNAPLNEPILQLCNSPGSSFIGFRQRSASTLCLPLMEDGVVTSTNSQRLLLIPALRLPIDRTGGHPHADLAIITSAGLRLGVVDTHGNWSIWQVSGKKSLSARLLYQARLLVSGKLWCWTEERLPPRYSDPYFDGWHKICFLTWQHNVTVVLVANRQHARLFDNGGAELEGVDMRLQSPSDCIIDVWINRANDSLCLALTSSRILLLCMGQTSTGRPSMQLICSFSHFLSGGDLTLRMSVLEASATIHVFIYSDRNPQLNVFSFHQGKEPASWSVQGPAPLNLYSELGLHFQDVADMICLPFRGVSKPLDDTASYLVIKVLLRLRDGRILEALYKYDGLSMCQYESNSASIINASALQQRRILSAQVVNEDEDEDEDEDDGFVVRSDVADPWNPNVLQNQAKSRGAERRSDWSWVFDSIDDSGTRAGIIECLEQAGARADDEINSTSKLTLLRELMGDFYIDDIDESERSLSRWADGLRTANSTVQGITLKRLTNAVPTGLLDWYSEITKSFVQSLSFGMSDRVRVNTERMSRQVAMDAASSLVAVQIPSQTQAQSEDKGVSPERSSARPTFDLYATIARLGECTSLSKPLATASSEAAVSGLIAHLPGEIDTAPEEYSYGNIELELARRKLQGRELDSTAKRRAERLEVARKKRAEKAQAVSKTAFSQETPVAVLSSSQHAEQRGMTQPERGGFGTRPLTGVKLATKKQKTAGF